MKRFPLSLWSVGLLTACFAAVPVAGCATGSEFEPEETGGTGTNGGNTGTGGASLGGATGFGGAAAGGVTTRGGAPGAGGSTSGGGKSSGGATFGGASSGGASLGGASSGGASAGRGGGPPFGRGGTSGTGGAGSGGRFGSGGAAAGGASTGGSGGGNASGGSSTTDPCSVTTMPAGAGTTVQSNNQQGKGAGGQTWTIWSNMTASGSITYWDVPAFKATWNNSGDFLARVGLQWNASKTYDQYGVITAQFSSKKTGTAGGFSYVGIYGWTLSPCVEWYIIDDSYNRMPVNPGSTTNKGTVMIDGGMYTMYTRNTTGTGGSKCGSSVNNWAQFYSVRNSARTCGTISITQHFDAWKAAGMAMGNLDQAQILIEAGGGVGSIEFPVASVTATMP